MEIGERSKLSPFNLPLKIGFSSLTLMNDAFLKLQKKLPLLLEHNLTKLIEFAA